MSLCLAHDVLIQLRITGGNEYVVQGVSKDAATIHSVGKVIGLDCLEG